MRISFYTRYEALHVLWRNFQRNMLSFRKKPETNDTYVEAVFSGIPIDPIYCAEYKNGRKEVIKNGDLLFSLITALKDGKIQSRVLIEREMAYLETMMLQVHVIEYEYKELIPEILDIFEKMREE